MLAQTTGRKQRRSQRVLWRTPMFVIWEAQAGLKVREQAETEIVNAHGALLRLQTTRLAKKSLSLLNPQTHESQVARVVWHDTGSVQEVRVGVELAAPSETFWGIYTPVPGQRSV